MTTNSNIDLPDRPAISKNIVILGSAGRVGVEAVKYLLRRTPYRLILVNKTSRVPDDIVRSYADRTEQINIDATDAARLSELCSRADLLISCIGPSNVIGPKIADVCRKTATAYIDAGGYDPLLAHLEKEEALNPSSVPLVINVGLLPGLSGMFPAYLIDKYHNGERCHKLDVHYVGRDAWSYNSSWDIIYGLGDFGKERGFCYLKEGEITKVSLFKAKGQAIFSEPVGKITTMMIYAEELRRLADSHSISNLNVYGANTGPRAALTCLIAKVFRMYSTPQKLAKAAKWLTQAAGKDMQKFAPFYGIQSTAHFSHGRKAQGELTLSDTYQATGIIIGIAAHMLMSHDNIPSGVHMLHDAVPAQPFMALLQAENIVEIKTTDILTEIRTAEAM